MRPSGAASRVNTSITRDAPEVRPHPETSRSLIPLRDVVPKASSIVGKQPKRAVVCEGMDGPQVSPVESQHRIRAELRRERHVHSIGQVEPQAVVANADFLCGVENIRGHFRKHRSTRPRPAPDIIDRMVRGFATKDPSGHVVEFAEQHRRNDQRPGVTQDASRRIAIGMSSVEGCQQPRCVCHDNDQRTGLLVRSYASDFSVQVPSRTSSTPPRGDPSVGV